MGQDLYEVLEISRSASEDEIRKSYKRLALVHHPDKNPSPQSEEKFKLIAGAYETLMDKNKRQLYDRHGEAGLRRMRDDDDDDDDDEDGPRFRQQFHDALFEHIFRRFFAFHFDEQHFFRRQHFHFQSSSHKKDVTIQHELKVSLEDIARGCIEEVTVPIKILTSNGIENQDKKFLVKIEPGESSGKKFTHQNKGHDTLPDGVAGDVVIIIRDEPHLIFKRDDWHLRHTAKVFLVGNPNQVTVQIPTLNSEKISLILKKNEFKPNTVKRFIGRGLPIPYNPKVRGDLVVTFEFQKLEPEWSVKELKDLFKFIQINKFDVNSLGSNNQNLSDLMSGAGHSRTPIAITGKMSKLRKKYRSGEAKCVIGGWNFWTEMDRLIKQTREE